MAKEEKTVVVEMLTRWGRNQTGDICALPESDVQKLLAHNPPAAKLVSRSVDRQERGAVNK